MMPGWALALPFSVFRDLLIQWAGALYFYKVILMLITVSSFPDEMDSEFGYNIS